MTKKLWIRGSNTISWKELYVKSKAVGCFEIQHTISSFVNGKVCLTLVPPVKAQQNTQ